MKGSAMVALLLTLGCSAKDPGSAPDAADPADAAVAADVDLVDADADSIDADSIDADPVDADPSDADPGDADPNDADPIDAGAEDAGPISVLVFSRTEGFRHDSIADGIAAIEVLGQANDFTVLATENDADFTDAELSNHRAVVFLSTTGDVLDPPGEQAFERYVQNGGGFVGVHSATDTEYGWAWYGALVGAYFSNHPAQQNATIVVEDAAHPSTSHLSASWPRFDEWYNFQTNPRGTVHVLLTLDESSYSGGDMGDHPIAWCHRYDGGRAWYTGGGHTSDSYAEPEFRAHLLGGILWATGRVDGDCE